ncbi:MAG: protein-L-isoaspartate O-methyltransferase [Lysobacterales bacterium RIFOXYD1_FULL_69_11]|nr:MAG: protein-L-isoaspartate O-methyltransferase [Xanthomonadales bacterium RIFOXYA1_FULL_69_10]OHE86138.1 MAG: protein-L-isoaspartate O-methyltransferase [Xanthomonadales bacterium RIFOXYD1_FULL_69_11]
MHGAAAHACPTRSPAFACVTLLAVLLAAPHRAPAQATADPYLEPRRELIARLRARPDARIDDAVLDVMARVPRHRFVPADQRRHAYENRPLPIGHGQTISQPYIVALMTSLADVGPGDRVLEIGTGSGYQAAVLAEAGAEVYSIEIIPALARSGRAALDAAGYRRVTTRQGDGYYGWKAHAPFDAIVVTAAAGNVPPPLVAQLKPGGRMVIPVGGSFMTQTLMVVTRDERGRVRTRQVLPVRFVPLTRDTGR